MMMRILCLLIGFAFGSIPTGFVVAKLHGVDVRKMGSGNIGSTNVLRNLGKKAGAMTLAGDILKALIPLFITNALFGGPAETKYLVTMYTGLGAVAGHDFSPWLSFKGGKGIATSGGVILYTDPRFFLTVLVTVIGTAALTGYVSLGSLMAAVIYIVVHFVVIGRGDFFAFGSAVRTYAPQYKAEILIIAVIMAGMAIWRHKGNIERLLQGKENKLSFKKKK